MSDYSTTLKVKIPLMKKNTTISSKVTEFSKRYSLRAKSIPIIIIAVIGLSTLLLSKAATFSIAIEPELASAKTGITTRTGDSTASNNGYIQFGGTQIGSGGSCPAYPSFPDTNCTGWQHTGVTLTPYTGSTTIDQSGTVIDSKDINGCIAIRANNVTIKRSRIRCAGSGPQDAGNMIVKMGVYWENWSNITLEDVEITRPAGSTGGADYGVEIYAKNSTITRANIYNITSGIHLLGQATPITIQDSYIHDLVNISGTDHNDNIIANGSTTNVIIQHNNLENPLSQVTPIAMYPEGSPNSYWRINKNLLNGGGSCLYFGAGNGEQPNNNSQITNNYFGTKFNPNCGDVDPVRETPISSLKNGANNIYCNNTWYSPGNSKNGTHVSAGAANVTKWPADLSACPNM